jgi:O-antigen/teichoic acid export membrane protein
VSGPVDASDHREFRTFLGSIGKLAAGRQISAGVLMVALLAFPNVATDATVEDVVWAYYAVLIFSTVLLLGLDRVAATVVAERGALPPAAALAPVMTLRGLSVIPLLPGLYLLFSFVDVTLPAGAWWACTVWIVAVQVQLTVFGALRSMGNAWTEPAVYITGRFAQAVALLALGSAGASVTAIVAALTVVDVAGALAAGVMVGRGWLDASGRRRVKGLRWRRIAAYTGMDLTALLYLRASVVIVARVLGPRAGASFGLLYRVNDSLVGLENAASLWLFSETVRRRGEARDARMLRDRSLALFPPLAALASLVLILASGLLGVFVPFLRGGVDTLRLLLIPFPFLVVSVSELFVRSALGRNREVLGIGAITLVANIALNVWLIDVYGFDGAAYALLASEALQLALVLAVAKRGERGVLVRQASLAALWVGLLLTVAVSLNAGVPSLAVAASVVVVSTIAGSLGLGRRFSDRRARRRDAVSGG